MNEPSMNRTWSGRIMKPFLLGIGIISVALAVVGIFLPLLPTVPLLLLAATCFARSSERFYDWLLDHPKLGPLIRTYRDGQGIPLSAKITAIVMIWISVPLSAFLFVSLAWVRGLLLGVAMGVTWYLLRLPTLEGKEASSE